MPSISDYNYGTEPLQKAHSESKIYAEEVERTTAFKEVFQRLQYLVGDCMEITANIDNKLQDIHSYSEPVPNPQEQKTPTTKTFVDGVASLLNQIETNNSRLNRIYRHLKEII